MDVAARVRDGRLEVRWGDGHRGEFHGVWLRDNCPCPGCRHPATGQRLLETAGLPDDIRIGETLAGPAGVRVAWGDGHAALFDA